MNWACLNSHMGRGRVDKKEIPSLPGLDWRSRQFSEPNLGAGSCRSHLANCIKRRDDLSPSRIGKQAFDSGCFFVDLAGEDQARAFDRFVEPWAFGRIKQETRLVGRRKIAVNSRALHPCQLSRIFTVSKKSDVSLSLFWACFACAVCVRQNGLCSSSHGSLQPRMVQWCLSQ